MERLGLPPARLPRWQGSRGARIALGLTVLLGAVVCIQADPVLRRLWHPFMGAKMAELKSSTTELHNWNLYWTTRPAVVVHASTVEDVISVVRDPSTYPSPVLPTGSRHSVTACTVNDGGTALDMSGLNRTLGLSVTEGLVRVQGGVRLADLHDWLADRGYEMSYSPEIGDATVGSLVTATSKDSSVDGPGYLSALVQEVTYVDGDGRLVMLRADRDAAALTEFLGSYGTAGIVVEVALTVRPAKVILTRTDFIPIGGNTREDYEKFASQLLRRKKKCANMLAIIDPGRGLAFLEQRFRLKNQTRWVQQAATPNSIAMTTIIRGIKYRAFLIGALPYNETIGLLESFTTVFNTTLPAVHLRRELVNRYTPVTPNQRRLDFSYFEHSNMTGFVSTVADALEFIHNYRAATGYVPDGLAMYFVDRVPGRPAGGNYRSPEPGGSFMLDPIGGEPESLQWRDFLIAFNAFSINQGATPSLTQTRFLQPSQVAPIPAMLAHPRLTTAYFKKFVAPS